ncbi:thermonuclease family protein [Teredinibacter purpureus]|uniref:thermonuclease family protein n=1 Tax=Teredinibacter purpureus TaxID=2731756 RepID=UPI0005F77754|nr:hypothetical protein [Teredinibacter purpureus]
MKSLLFFIAASFFTIYAQAQDSYVDLRSPNISGKVIDVPAPNVLQVRTKKDGEYKTFFVEIIHVDFGDQKNLSCRSHKKNSSVLHKQGFRTTEYINPDIKKACAQMDGWLDGKDVHIEITEWSQPITKGFIFVGSTNINYELIARGWYRADYTQSRDASLVLLEKQARCQRVGIWGSKMGIPEEDMKCQD